ncbi:unnamed protein product [Danaus chrysippus]|uniref:(African queen) hypothetical protein n=1 Tax=Danaus chrysippus TaxID=151541 RepID=A0A8J2VZJ3_9NEOP|nr:unnamed protein product [Danaus chrysippus]
MYRILIVLECNIHNADKYLPVQRKLKSRIVHPKDLADGRRCARRAVGGEKCHVELGAPARPGRPGSASDPAAAFPCRQPAASLCASSRSPWCPTRPVARRPASRASWSLAPRPQPAPLKAAPRLHAEGRRTGGGAAGGLAQVRPAHGPGPQWQRAEARARRGARSWSRPGRSSWS